MTVEPIEFMQLVGIANLGKAFVTPPARQKELLSLFKNEYSKQLAELVIIVTTGQEYPKHVMFSTHTQLKDIFKAAGKLELFMRNARDKK